MMPARDPTEIDLADIIDFRPKFSPDERTMVVSVRLPESVALLMARVRENIPVYGTNSELARDAIWTYCVGVSHKLAINDPKVQSLIRDSRHQGQVQYLAELGRRVTKYTHNLQDVLLEALVDEEFQQAQFLLEEFWENFTTLADDWERRKIRATLNGSPVLKAAVTLLKKYGYTLPPGVVAEYS